MCDLFPFSARNIVDLAISLPNSGQFAPQINEALNQQGIRLDKAAAEEKKRKALAAESRKRPSSNANEPLDNKRIKLESEVPNTTSAAFLSAFDFTSLPAPLITNLIVANLEAFTEPQLIATVNAYRQSRGLTITRLRPVILDNALLSSPNITVPSKSTAGHEGNVPMVRKIATAVEKSQTPPAELSEPVVKDEPVDPLQMDIDEDELEYEPEKLNEAVSNKRSHMFYTHLNAIFL